jgi:HD-like signal output (HDOD) protein
MPSNPDPTINATLRRLGPLQDLSEAQLSDIAADVELLHAHSGSRLIEIGDNDQRQLFLVRGEVELVAQDGAAHLVGDADPAARGPISRLRPSRYRVTARSAVTYMLIDQSLLDQTAARHGVIVEESFVASRPNDLEGDSDPLLVDVFADINAGTVVVPSYSEVAVRVGRALHHCEQDTARFVDTLCCCPALALKILRSARTAAASHQVPRSVRSAVERVGIDGSYALAVSCVLRETLRSDAAPVMQCMQDWWQRSIRAAAIARALAQQDARMDPDYAAMIGLLQAIAEPVMLTYADRHPDLADTAALSDVIRGNRAELGRILLTMWSMPREVIDAAAHFEDWLYDHPGRADYLDVAVIAQWYALAGSDNGDGLPPLDEVPAAHRLGLRASGRERDRLDAVDRGALDRVAQLLAD